MLLGRRVRQLAVIIATILCLLQMLGPIQPARAAALTTNHTWVAFGPLDMVRHTNAPGTVTQSFSVRNPKTSYTLQVINGGLNGQQIVGPSDFNQQVTVIEKPITLLATNTISEELASAPGSGILEAS